MGTDICVHKELKVFGRWEYDGEIEVCRNYDLFKKMANIFRGDSSIVPISEPRGYPDDMNNLTKYYCGDPCDYDYHNVSYLNLEEIKELMKWMKSCASYQESFYQTLSKMTYLSDEIEDARIIFYFWS